MQPAPIFKRFAQLLRTLMAPTSKKGDNGKVGIIGGSIEFVGPPYFSGMAAMRCVS